MGFIPREWGDAHAAVPVELLTLAEVAAEDAWGLGVSVQGLGFQRLGQVQDRVA